MGTLNMSKTGSPRRAQTRTRETILAEHHFISHVPAPPPKLSSVWSTTALALSLVSLMEGLLFIWLLAGVVLRS